ncbi:hypothetical protein PG985_012704 [Apiospora marii]|uniref:uncharacterized protein n=1 Tax=Apiospora marii TaxID=335849 RepID=UPI00312E2A04
MASPKNNTTLQANGSMQTRRSARAAKKTSAKIGDSDSDSDDQPQKSAELKYGQQRVWMKGQRAIKLVEEKLKNTAYTTLTDANKKAILAMIKEQLKENIEEDQKIMPAGVKLDYEQLVNGVIRKVFGNNLHLFVRGKEDTPVLNELLNYKA